MNYEVNTYATSLLRGVILSFIEKYCCTREDSFSADSPTCF